MATSCLCPLKQMIRITIPGKECYNDQTGEFVNTEAAHLQLEHSLVSISRWEAKWHKPFLDKKKPKTAAETLDYIRCMCTNVDPDLIDPVVFYALPQSEMDRITKYIEDPMTASWINERTPEGAAPPHSTRVLTSELIYCYMIQLGIPVEFENWHLNRLIMLIKIVNIENQPKKKMSKKETMAQHRALNAARRKSGGKH